MSKRRRYEEIDALRGFAATWVLLSHYLPFWEQYIGPAPIIVPNEWGWYAVKLFFVISGFVIFMTLDRCRSVTEFAVLRTSRLYPTYWGSLALAAGIGGLVFGEDIWLTAVAANATMFQEFLGFHNFDVVYWSLTVELGFYLICAALLAVGLHRRPLLFVSGWLVVSAAWAILGSGPQPVTDREWLSLVLVVDFAPYFGAGIVFYTAEKRGWDRQKASLIAAAVATELLISGAEGGVVMGICLILFQLAVTERMPFIVTGPTLWLGTISYALYLIHRNLGYHLLRYLGGLGLGPVSAVAITTAGALILASGLTFLVEKPALRRIRPWYAARAEEKPETLP